VMGLGRRFGVDPRLDGDVSSFIWVALSGSFSCMKQGGRQMLGLRSQGLVSPKHGGLCKGVYEGVEVHGSSKCKQ
jgi:hypothetical protein